MANTNYTLKIPFTTASDLGLDTLPYSKLIKERTSEYILYKFTTRAKQLQFACEYANLAKLKIRGYQVLFISYS